MKNQKPTKQTPEEQTPVVVESADVKKVTKQKKKAENAVEQVKDTTQETGSRAGKAEVKAEKVKKVKEKEHTAAKEDKTTKFLVSMKKSVRKNLKKQAAESGISMNEYIVAAVVQKLAQDGVNS